MSDPWQTCRDDYPDSGRNSTKRTSIKSISNKVDLTKIAELGQAYSTFELIRTMATQAQTRYGKHLELTDVERMGDIAKYADVIIERIMKAFDNAK